MLMRFEEKISKGNVPWLIMFSLRESQTDSLNVYYCCFLAKNHFQVKKKKQNKTPKLKTIILWVHLCKVGQ